MSSGVTVVDDSLFPRTLGDDTAQDNTMCQAANVPEELCLPQRGVQKPFLASSKDCCGKNASPRHVLLELQERSSMEERLHARSPLATTRSPLTTLVTNQVTPGY